MELEQAPTEVNLRPPRFNELEFIRRLWADPATMAPVGGPVLLTDSAARDWYARMVDPGRPSNYYCLILAGKRPVGEVSYRDLDPATRTAWLNIKVLAGQRGKGHGRTALLQFLDIYFRQHEGQVMMDDLAMGNLGGRALLSKCGFRPVAGPPEVYRMSLQREDYLRLRAWQD